MDRIKEEHSSNLNLSSCLILLILLILSIPDYVCSHAVTGREYLSHSTMENNSTVYLRRSLAIVLLIAALALNLASSAGTSAPPQAARRRHFAGWSGRALPAKADEYGLKIRRSGA